MNRVIRGYESVERFFMGGNRYIFGDSITLADFSIWTALLVLDLLFPVDGEKFPKLRDYLNMMKTHKSYGMNQEGALKQADLIEKCMQKAKNYHINSFELVYPKPI